MSKKIIIVIIVSNIVAIGVGVYGGMRYEKSVIAKADQSNVRSFASGNRQSGQNQGQQGAGTQTNRFAGPNGGQGGSMMRRGGANGGSFVSGEILSKDDKGLTIKTPDGGSAIVYFSNTLTVRKADVASLSDVVVGQQVMINGKSSPDGSIIADTLSITPAVAK